jgi:3-deoxy-D-manno-octulosonic-acid transferase
MFSVANTKPEEAPAPASVQWLIVPRHPQRFDAVTALIEAHGFAVSRRSQWHDAAPEQPLSQAPTIWLGDSLGEMALYYGLADVALLGGSFEPLGGQNLIEAAACGCPLLMGPHTFNFSEAAELAQTSGAALRVSNLAEAVAAAVSLTRDATRLQATRQAAEALASRHRGATERLCQAIEQLLASQPPARH